MPIVTCPSYVAEDSAAAPYIVSRPVHDSDVSVHQYGV